MDQENSEKRKEITYNEPEEGEDGEFELDDPDPQPTNFYEQFPSLELHENQELELQEQENSNVENVPEELPDNSSQPKEPSEDFIVYSEKFLKKLYFKAARTGSVATLKQAIKKTKGSEYTPVEFFYMKRDAENRTFFTICLQNAQFELI